MRVKSNGILRKLIRNAGQGRRKFISLYRAHGLREALGRTWNNIFLIETVCRLEKDLTAPDEIVEPAIPLNIEIMGMDFDLVNWHGKRTILELRGEYGMEQFRARLARGDLCFAAYSNGGFAGFVWLEFPPGGEAGYPLQLQEAYTYDGWTFEKFRGKRILPVIQQVVMGHVRGHYKEINRLVTHVAVWNKPSLSGDQRAGYIIRRLERTIMILGIHRKQVLARKIPADLFMHQQKT